MLIAVITEIASFTGFLTPNAEKSEFVYTLHLALALEAVLASKTVAFEAGAALIGKVPFL